MHPRLEPERHTAPIETCSSLRRLRKARVSVRIRLVRQLLADLPIRLSIATLRISVDTGSQPRDSRGRPRRKRSRRSHPPRQRTCCRQHREHRKTS